MCAIGARFPIQTIYHIDVHANCLKKFGEQFLFWNLCRNWYLWRNFRSRRLKVRGGRRWPLDREGLAAAAKTTIETRGREGRLGGGQVVREVHARAAEGTHPVFLTAGGSTPRWAMGARATTMTTTTTMVISSGRTNVNYRNAVSMTRHQLVSKET